MPVQVVHSLKINNLQGFFCTVLISCTTFSGTPSKNHRETLNMDIETQLRDKDGLEIFHYGYLFSDSDEPYGQRLKKINSFEAALTEELPRAIALATATLNRVLINPPSENSAPSKRQVEVAEFIINASLQLAKIKK